MSLSISVSVLSTKLIVNQLRLAWTPSQFLVVHLTLFPPGGTLCPPHYYCPPSPDFWTAPHLLEVLEPRSIYYITLTSQNLTEGPYLKKEIKKKNNIRRTKNRLQIQFYARSRIILILSGHVPEIQAEVEVVKIKNPDFSCWA